MRRALAMVAVAALATATAASARVIERGAGNDRIVGTAQRDVIRPDGGNDRVFSLAGNDVVLAAAGNDYVLGSAGDDAIFGGLGVDVLFGGAGDDYINDTGSPRFGFMAGNAGRDRLRSSGPVAGYGGPGPDQVGGSPFVDVLHGGTEDDTIRAGGADDDAAGGRGRDTIFGDAGRDHLYGNEGRDLINGGPDTDRIYVNTRRDVTGPGDSLGDAAATNGGNDAIYARDGEADLIICNGVGRERVFADEFDIISGATPSRPRGDCFIVTRRPFQAEGETQRDEDAKESPREDRRVS